MRTPTLRVVFLAGLLVVPSCGGDSTSPSSIAGTYTLVSVDGDSLPQGVALYQDSAGGLVEKVLVSGYMLLNSGGTYSESYTFRNTEYDPFTVQPTGRVWTDDMTTSGSWTYTGSVITFTHGASGRTFTGSISGNTLTIDGSVYRKSWRYGM
jgi:hypothetical protein